VTGAVFSVELVQTTDKSCLVVVGEVDLATEPAVVDAARRAIADGEGRPLTVDLRGVQFMDSTGLRALLKARDMARHAGIPFTVCASEGPVLRLFRVAGVEGWFDLV
jgi:anti-anti-sigma factor